MTFNILIPAMQAISILGSNQNFLFFKYIRTDVDKMGRDVPVFDEPKQLTGSIQPVQNSTYEQLGLDLNKNYITIFSPSLLQSIAQQIQPDRVKYNDRIYEVVDNKDWFNKNGWTKVLLVELKGLRNDNPAI